VRIDEFDYALPPERIAQEPLPERDASRLMILDRSAAGPPRDARFQDLPELLSPGDLLVVNRSRVFPARLLGTRPNGGQAEVLLVRRLGGAEWEALVRPGRRLHAGDVVSVADGFSVVIGAAAGAGTGRRRVRLDHHAGDPEAAIETFGRTPLPPYVRRDERPGERERYQTLFARERGSVAAPTAGLHFSERLLARLAARGVERTDITLHVGPGTFQPIRVADVERHRLEPEPFSVPAATVEAVERARRRGKRVVAVGTTSVRALESVARSDGTLEAREGETDCVIVPGHRFRAVDALLTNFHLPRSSLLLLVSAFAGRERVLSAYDHAIRSGYRFYSYGDAMLIL